TAPTRARDAATLAAALARDSGQRLLHARATAALARAHEAHGDAGPAHEARTEATALYATLGVRHPPGTPAPSRPLPHHRHRELPPDAESRLTLYLTEHFDG
ncbi:hypothetical protein AB0D52_33425, partial [Streptomyces sp. NPDC048256]